MVSGEIDAYVEVLVGRGVRTAGNQSRALCSVPLAVLVEYEGQFEIQWRVIPSDEGDASMANRSTSVRKPNLDIMFSTKSRSDFNEDALASAEHLCVVPIGPPV